MSIEVLEKEIAELDEQIKPLLLEKHKRQKRLEVEQSKLFIKVNGITKDMVQRDDEEDLPWFGTVWKFGEWCKENSKKPWLSWNGRLYRTSEIQAGQMAREAVGRYDELD